MIFYNNKKILIPHKRKIIIKEVETKSNSVTFTLKNKIKKVILISRNCFPKEKKNKKTSLKLSLMFDSIILIVYLECCLNIYMLIFYTLGSS